MTVRTPLDDDDWDDDDENDDDICKNYHGGNPESVDAHDATRPHKERDHRLIVAHVATTGDYGATCDEIEIATGLSHQTASARCSELVKKGRLIRKTTDGRIHVKRLTRRGCGAAVLFLPNGQHTYGQHT